MNQQQVIKTKRNNDKLVHDGALYVFHKFSNDGLKKFWRCEFHGPAGQCKGRLHTIWSSWRFRIPIVFISALRLTRSNSCWRTLAFLNSRTEWIPTDSHFWKSVYGRLDPPGLNALQAQIPPQLNGVFNWFLDNYTDRMRFNVPMTAPLFDPHEWSVHQRTLDGADRTNNFAEAFHRKLQRQFSCTHPTIWRFIDTIRCEQKALDADMARCMMGEAAPQKKRKYRDADSRILRLVQRYNDVNIVPQNDHNYANPNVNPENINNFLAGISRNYEMRP